MGLRDGAASLRNPAHLACAPRLRMQRAQRPSDRNAERFDGPALASAGLAGHRCVGSRLAACNGHLAACRSRPATCGLLLATRPRMPDPNTGATLALLIADPRDCLEKHPIRVTGGE